ncbi:MAG: ABC transporter ATP-binding protein [Candidatus Rokubacteria bacterium]|nr:ABC transporter ATP-binding protein [Candidatus Rokubacteria bacterium]MBI2525675.1 ABC transporter ATP-binding protein [Candidatus Rokubacteria bacterium]
MALLRLSGLRKAFGSLQVIEDLELTVEAGRITSVIGPNGAGKTTLFNLITGRLPLDAGRILFKERPITGLTPDAIARLGLARSFQITNVFPALSVRENVRLAAQAHEPGALSPWRPAERLAGAADRAEAALAQVGLSALRDRLAQTLSHGDQRHLEIAMTLATGPELLLLDEPTSGMSAVETGRTMTLIGEIARRVTVLIIEHDMDLVMGLSHRVAVMAFGRKIAEGTPAEVARDPEVRRVYLGDL